MRAAATVIAPGNATKAMEFYYKKVIENSTNNTVTLPGGKQFAPVFSTLNKIQNREIRKNALEKANIENLFFGNNYQHAEPLISKYGEVVDAQNDVIIMNGLGFNNSNNLFTGNTSLYSPLSYRSNISLEGEEKKQNFIGYGLDTSAKWLLDETAKSTSWYASRYENTGEVKYLAGVVPAFFTPETFTMDAVERVGDYGKSFFGMAGGASQVVYGAKNMNPVVVLHGTGNYVGAVGDMRDVFYGGDRKWNFTKNLYGDASNFFFGDKAIGENIFHGLDLVLGVNMAMKPSNSIREVITTQGVSLEHAKKIPSIMNQGGYAIAHDMSQLYNSAKTALNSFFE